MSKVTEMSEVTERCQRSQLVANCILTKDRQGLCLKVRRLEPGQNRRWHHQLQASLHNLLILTFQERQIKVISDLCCEHTFHNITWTEMPCFVP